MADRRLQDLIRRIGAPEAVCWGLAKPGESDLFEAEARAIARAVPCRKSEFAAGRRAARRAIAALGLPLTAIPMGPARAPVWPEGLVGSISHAGGLCLAVVARTRDVTSIGVDIEADRPMTSDLISEICHPTELAGVQPEARADIAKRIFSAKEAAYKAHYPTFQRVFGFHGLNVDLRAGRAQFTDHPEVASFPPESRAELPLKQVTGGGLILSLCVIPTRA